MCNIWLKFGKLWAYGKQVGADFVATGHYARIATGRRRHAPGRPRRSTGRRTSPTSCSGSAASCCRTSSSRSASYPKAEIRAMARELGLPVHDKPDSQEICFVPDDDYLGFVRERRPDLRHRRARSSTRTATLLGTHAGIEGFTIGQRRGLGIAVGEPRYVVADRAASAGP